MFTSRVTVIARGSHFIFEHFLNGNLLEGVDVKEDLARGELRVVEIGWLLQTRLNNFMPLLPLVESHELLIEVHVVQLIPEEGIQDVNGVLLGLCGVDPNLSRVVYFCLRVGLNPRLCRLGTHFTVIVFGRAAVAGREKLSRIHRAGKRHGLVGRKRMILWA